MSPLALTSLYVTLGFAFLGSYAMMVIKLADGAADAIEAASRGGWL